MADYQIVINGSGRSRHCIASWPKGIHARWMELSLFWFARRLAVPVPLQSISEVSYAFRRKMLPHRPLTATVVQRYRETKVITGKIDADWNLPPGPFSGIVGNCCLHWAIELLDNSKQVLVREYFEYNDPKALKQTP